MWFLSKVRAADADGASGSMPNERKPGFSYSVRAAALASVTVSSSCSSRLPPRFVDRVPQQRRADAAAAVLGSDVHAEHGGLVPVLRPRLAAEPDDAGERLGRKRAADGCRGRPCASRGEDRIQRLVRFLLVARRERFGVLAQAAQPQLAIGGRVGGAQPADLDVR